MGRFRVSVYSDDADLEVRFLCPNRHILEHEDYDFIIKWDLDHVLWLQRKLSHKGYKSRLIEL